MSGTALVSPDDSVTHAAGWRIGGLETATQDDRDAFQHLTEPYRRELQLHCYRMLGSLQDAEDLVQETYLRAWRGLDTFEGRTSLRAWLYRIATNACLNALARRVSARRVLPQAYGPPADGMPSGAPATEVPWLGPYPDSVLEGVPDRAPGPEARYELHEAVQLAFVAAIQHLPPRQRAVLLLRDVLGWSAVETADQLDTSVASANSALQRARATLKRQFPEGRPEFQPAPDDRQRALLERYVQAWEGPDPHALVDLLTRDVVLSMPPYPHWYRGQQAIREFFAWVRRPGGPTPFHFVGTAANRQPAFAMYSGAPDGTAWRAHGIHVLTLEGDAIAAMTTFREPGLFAAFGLPPVLPVSSKRQ